MTSTVRIEKADTTIHKLIVRQQDRQQDGTWRDVGDPVRLQNPCELLALHAWDTRRLVIEEVVEDKQTQGIN